MGIWVVEPGESIELLHVCRAVTEHVLPEKHGSLNFEGGDTKKSGLPCIR